MNVLYESCCIHKRNLIARYEPLHAANLHVKSRRVEFRTGKVRALQVEHQHHPLTKERHHGEKAPSVGALVRDRSLLAEHEGHHLMRQTDAEEATAQGKNTVS